MSQATFTVLVWLFVLYEAAVFVGVTALMLIEKRSLPPHVDIPEESPREVGWVLAILGAFVFGLVLVFFAGS